MKKRIIVAVVMVTLILSMSLPVAAQPARYSDGLSGGYSLMVDRYGYFLDREAFETNLDKAIADGLINEADRDIYVSRYDYCMNYVNGYAGGRGGCCWRGDRINFYMPSN